MVHLTEHDAIEMGADGEYVEVDAKSDAFKRNTILNPAATGRRFSHKRLATWQLPRSKERKWLSAVVDLSPFWLLSFDDIMAIAETVADGEDGFSLFLPDLQDLTASNFRKLLSNGRIRELRVGKHQIGGLGQFLHAVDETCVTDFNTPDLYSRSFARVNTRFASAEEEAMEDDLTVEPLTGELTAFASRHAARNPCPFVPTLPLEQERYTIAIFYEHSLKEDKEHPLRLRHAIATLDSEGRTRVISASDFLHALEPTARATELAREWGEEAARVCGALECEQRRMARRFLVRGGKQGWSARTEKEIDRLGDDGVPSLGLEVSSPAEADELFKALSESRRLATDTPDRGQSCLIQC
ncbi:hypothetical protein MBLNU13_g06883t2 [Cladosporium sp. NU13]